MRTALGETRVPEWNGIEPPYSHYRTPDGGVLLLPTDREWPEYERLPEWRIGDK